MNFQKWHGAGNDFVLMVGSELPENVDLSGLARQVCHRHFGIGADGLMVVYPSEIADLKMVYYNSDGSYAAMCGNGIRCFSAYCHSLGLITKMNALIETGDGIKEIVFEDTKHYQITVDMGIPSIEPQAIPSLLPKKHPQVNTIDISDRHFSADMLKVGVPHLIVDVTADFNVTQDAREYGRQLEVLSAFPERTNVNFVRKTSENQIRVDTWERGAGLTLACGTGVCASAYSYVARGLVKAPVLVEVSGGQLRIDIKDNRIFMTGPAQCIAKGMFSK